MNAVPWVVEQAGVVALRDAASWPTWDQWQNVLWLQDYNTRIVVISVALLGIAAGLVGSFTLLRKRALIGDALAHASLPGITVAFLVGTAAGGNGKSLPWLLMGATVGGLLGVALILLVQRSTRLKQDAALGIVLSVFFGAGAAMLSVIQQMPTGSAAGLENFIYGKTASIKQEDATLILAVAVASLLVCVVLFKELKLLCFDANFADAQGLSSTFLDIVLMTMVVAVTIVGLKAVGLILIVALLVIPPAAARFWTESFLGLAVISAVFGMISGVLGAVASALLPNLPSGAMIVLVGAGMFLVSMLVAPSRGVLPRHWRRWRVNRNVDRQHLLRGLFELLEKRSQAEKVTHDGAVTFAELLNLRSWSRRRLRRTLRRVEMEGWIRTEDQAIRLTVLGRQEAARLTRQHRLWELYLIHHAEVAPTRVDRDADAIEHVLEPEVVDELAAILDQRPVTIPVPADPHEQEATR